MLCRGMIGYFRDLETGKDVQFSGQDSVTGKCYFCCFSCHIQKSKICRVGESERCSMVSDVLFCIVRFWEILEF